MFLCGLVLLISACSPNSDSEWIRHDNWSVDTQFAKWPITHQGLSVGFVQTEHRDIHPYQRPSNTEFHIQAGDAFTTSLILSTGYDEPYPVLVSVILDYEQVRFSLDGREGLLHYLEVPSGVDLEMPMEVAVQTAGRHDLFVIAFREPDSHPVDPQDRLPPALSVGGRRTVICVDDCTVPARDLPVTHVGQLAGASTHGTISALPLLPGSDRPQQRLLLTSNAWPGEPVALELWAKNDTEQTRDYIVLAFLDFQQIAFGSFEAIHLSMPPGSEIFIPGAVKVPDERGLHELQFVYIFDPFQAIDTEVRDPFVQSQSRSAITVK
jgi:hypothetical protein